MDSKKSFIYSKVLKKGHPNFDQFEKIAQSFGYETVYIDDHKRLLQHLKNEKMGAVFCDDALFKGLLEKGLEELREIQDRVSFILMVTKPSHDISYNPIIDTFLVLSLPDKLFEQLIFSVFKYIHLKDLYAGVSNAINPEFVKKLLSDTAHAVNNILSGMQGYAELAQLNPDDSKLIQDAFNVVIYSSYRVKQEIKNLRALVRVENPVIEPIDVTKVLEESLDLAKNQIVAKNVHVKYEIDRNIMVDGDYDQLVQVFFNLLNDIVDNMEETGSMGITFKPRNGAASISIVGKGYLIDREGYTYLERIFATQEPILRSASEDGKIDSRSALSICNRIIHNHGGQIQLKKKGEQELSYTVTIPLSKIEVEAPSAEEEYEKIAYANLKNLDMDILVVDDEEYVRNTIYYFFDKKGCRVIVAEDGEFGFDIAKTKPFDLIFMDYLMPKMGGIEAARKIMEKNKDVKIVFITGRESLNEQELYKSGIYACIKKPFEMKDLFNIAKKVAFQKGIVE